MAKAIVTMLVLAMLLASVAGCGQDASVRRGDGSVVQGIILGSDAETIHLRQNDGTTEVAVPRADVVDIDHPGNVAIVAGLLATVVGAIPVGIGISMWGDSGVIARAAGPMAFWTGLAILGGGLYAAIGGGLTYQQSSNAAAAPEQAWLLSPVAVTDGATVGFGVAGLLRF